MKQRRLELSQGDRILIKVYAKNDHAGVWITDRFGNKVFLLLTRDDLTDIDDLLHVVDGLLSVEEGRMDQPRPTAPEEN